MPIWPTNNELASQKENITAMHTHKQETLSVDYIHNNIYYSTLHWTLAITRFAITWIRLYAVVVLDPDVYSTMTH